MRGGEFCTPPIQGGIPIRGGQPWSAIYDEGVYSGAAKLRMPLSSKCEKCRCASACPGLRHHIRDQEYCIITTIRDENFEEIKDEKERLNPLVPMPENPFAVVYHEVRMMAFVKKFSIRVPEVQTYDPQIPAYYIQGFESEHDRVDRRVDAESKMDDEEKAEHSKRKKCVSEWAQSMFCPDGKVGAVTFYRGKHNGIKQEHWNVVLNSRLCANKGGNHTSCASYLTVRAKIAFVWPVKHLGHFWEAGGGKMLSDFSAIQRSKGFNSNKSTWRFFS